MALSVEDERKLAGLVIRYIAIRRDGADAELMEWRWAVRQAFPNGEWGNRLCVSIGERLKYRGEYPPRVEGVA